MSASRVVSRGLTASLVLLPLLVGQALAAPPAEDLLVFHEGGRARPVRTPDDWAKRRREVLAGMQAAMGPLPSREHLPDLDVRVLDEQRGEGFRRLKISFVAEKKDRIPAYFYLPTDRAAGERRAAVLALHPTSPLGKGVVAGESTRANRSYGLELARRGYVVLCPDYPSFGDYEYDFAGDDYVSGTMKGVFNHMRCVDLLCSREEVDPRRIGVIGHSLGGHNAIFVAAFDARLKAVVSSCGWTPFHDYYGGRLAGWTSARYMPRLRTEYDLDPDRAPFDFPEVIASLAPRAFFSNSPLYDDNFAVAGVKRTMPQIRRVYELLDAADQLQVRYPDAPHDFPPATRKEAYAFLDRALGHAPGATGGLSTSASGARVDQPPVPPVDR
jgi:acetyl esterase/lipase